MQGTTESMGSINFGKVLYRIVPAEWASLANHKNRGNPSYSILELWLWEGWVTILVFQAGFASHCGLGYS